MYIICPTGKGGRMAGNRKDVAASQKNGNQGEETIQEAGRQMVGEQAQGMESRGGDGQERDSLEGKPGAGKTVQVRLPRNQGNNPNQDEFFSVNFKNYIVKRGKYVDVPPELEEVIRNGERAEEAAFKYAEEKALREA